jgi:hypothetical protein
MSVQDSGSPQPKSKAFVLLKSLSQFLLTIQVAEREQLREERHRERERQRRIAAAAPDKRNRLMVGSRFTRCFVILSA